MTEEEKKQTATPQGSNAEMRPVSGQEAQAQTAAQPNGQTAAAGVPQAAPSSKVDENRRGATIVPAGRPELSMPEVNPTDRREEMEYMVRNKPMGDEEGQERKRNRARSFVAAIGDGVSALANLYFTTQYAPNANMQPSLSRQNKERFDRRMEEFRARRKEYEAGLQRAKDRDRDNNRYAQEWKLRMQQARAAEQEKQRAAAAKEAAAKAAEARHKDEMALKKADADERRRHNEAMERNGARTARAAEVRASRSGRTAAGGKPGGYTITREDLGTVETYPNSGEWERAARNAAKELGVETKDISYTKNGEEVTRHTAPHIVSDVERAAKEKAAKEKAEKASNSIPGLNEATEGEDESNVPPSRRKKK